MKNPAGLNRVTDCIKREPLVPFFKKGGGGGRGVSEDVLPQKILKFQSPKKVIFSVLGTKVRTKEHVFHSRKCSCHSTFDLSVTINSRKQ